MQVAALVMLAVVAQPTLELPWACGDSYMCTQDHNTGSHTGYGAWAWDFGLSVGTDVWAAADGTVAMLKMDSNSGGCDSAYANDGNYVLIDHGDGSAALYLHMAQWSSNLSVGQFVWAGEPLAEIGLTGWVCGAHLHFQVQSVCGSWWCQSMTAQFFTYGDPSYGDWLTSGNCGSPPTCNAVLAGGETVISEDDASCFLQASQWWWDVAEGHDGHHYYTYATDEPVEDTTGDWVFGVDTPGDYEVLVHIPSTEANSELATYKIHHANGVSAVQLNQATDKGWQSLGVFAFDGAGDPKIHLGDNTGEDYDTLMRKLAYDAVKLAYVPPGDDDDDVGDDDGGDDDGGDDDGGDDDGGDDDSTGDDDGADDDTADDGDDDGPPGPPGGPPGSEAGACSCRLDGPAAASTLALPWLALAALFRRRR